jgi:HD-GYP domain-containing protein (c-di-GMP phosphodiesterase class II)
MRLSEERIKLIYKTSLIHDIGKINISQDVLNKKTKLDDSELSQIHAHPLVGYEIIKDVHNFENMAKIILQHHERLDGSGYPYGLVSDEIMIEAKIIAVADVFEAMTSKRPYGGAFEIPKVLDTLRSGSGKFYDDAAVAACLDLFEKENLRLN